MILREKFKDIIEDAITHDQQYDSFEQIAEDFTTNFTKWKDDNFHKYRDGKYYANTSSSYFDITKYVGKEKATTYYTLEELMNLYKKTL